jgi:hypothetical protein
VVLDFELDLQLDLVRDPHLELKPAALELDVVVAASPRPTSSDGTTRTLVRAPLTAPGGRT